MDTVGFDALQRCLVALVTLIAHGLDVATRTLAAMLGETDAATVPMAMAVGIGLAWMLLALGSAVAIRRLGR